MAAVDLATQGIRGSAAMVLAYFAADISLNTKNTIFNVFFFTLNVFESACVVLHTARYATGIPHSRSQTLCRLQQR